MYSGTTPALNNIVNTKKNEMILRNGSVFIVKTYAAMAVNITLKIVPTTVLATLINNAFNNVPCLNISLKLSSENLRGKNVIPPFCASTPELNAKAKILISGNIIVITKPIMIINEMMRMTIALLSWDIFIV